MTAVEKVSALVTRPDANGHELLVFHHDRSGVQIPAGTVEPGEDPLDAVARELREESGLDLTSFTHLATIENPDALMIMRPTPVYSEPRPDAPVLRNVGRRFVQRREARHGFVRILVEDGDWDHDPPVISSSVEGWVDEDATAHGSRRYVYHAHAPDGVADRWALLPPDDGAGDCEFRFFWVPLERRPARLLAGQADWVERAWTSLARALA